MQYTDESDVYTESKTILCGHLSEVLVENTPKCSNYHKKASNESLQKSVVWTADAIFALLHLYESKLGMLTTPKKKTGIWIAISHDLKDYGIKVSPDQVRWKINALTKRYKQCIDSGCQNRFKYFTELSNIYEQYNVTCYTKSELIVKKNYVPEESSPLGQESKAIIELRKCRLAHKIQSDKCQSKVQLEKQWLEYLKRQEEDTLLEDSIYERSFKLREEELELRKRELKTRESIESGKLHSMEKELEESINLEREKCELLKNIFT